MQALYTYEKKSVVLLYLKAVRAMMHNPLVITLHFTPTPHTAMAECYNVTCYSALAGTNREQRPVTRTNREHITYS